MTEAGNFEGSNILVRATSDPPELRGDQAGAAGRARGAGAAGARRQAPDVVERADDLRRWPTRARRWSAPTTSPRRSPARASSSASCATPSGRLLRTFNRGRAKLPAYLEDHAYLLEAYLTLYEATFDAAWFARAVELADELLERFYDPERGGFFSVADDHTGLIARRKDLEDAPIPSGGSAACFGLLRLARFTGEARYEDAALSLIRLLHAVAPEHPLAFGHLLRAIDFPLGPVREVALAGDDVSALARVVRGGVLPLRRAGGRRGRRAAAAGPRPGRRAGRRLRLRALHLPAAGHDTEDLTRRSPRSVSMMARLLTLPAGRTAKWFVLIIVVLIYGGLASQAGKLEGAQKNESSSWLPADAESVKALEAVKRFPGGELAPAVVVYERRGGLTDADKTRIDDTVTQAQRRPPRRSCWRRRSRSSPPTAPRRSSSSPSSPATARGRLPERRAVDPRPDRRARRGPRGQAHRRRRLQPRRDQGLRRHQRHAAVRGGGDRPDPARSSSTGRRSSGRSRSSACCSPRARRAARATCWPRRA